MHDLVYFYPHGHEAHQEYAHPERPERVEAMVRGLKQMGWWDAFPHLAPVQVPQQILEAIHAPEYLSSLESASSRGRSMDLDTYTTTETWNLALKAVGGAIVVARSVWDSEAQRGFALTRPPGHHATPSRAMGFCLLNNVALAAEDLIRNRDAARVAIVDLDQHHGNGTQDIFWERDDVFYVSTHQSPHYPGTGRVSETGVGEGEGKTANFPLPPRSGDEAFETVMEEAILPLLDRFAPEMILVSYGFDSHWRDPLGQLLLSATGYKNLIKALTDWADEHCQGRISLVLEGGYDLDAAAVCTQAVVAALLSRGWEDRLGPPHQAATETWRSMLEEAKNVWDL